MNPYESPLSEGAKSKKIDPELILDFLFYVYIIFATAGISVMFFYVGLVEEDTPLLLLSLFSVIACSLTGRTLCLTIKNSNKE